MINDLEIFKDLSRAMFDLDRTINNKIDVNTLNNKKAQELTTDINNFIIYLRKYWLQDER